MKTITDEFFKQLERENKFSLWRKKPIIIRAVQMDEPFEVFTPEGPVVGNKGDWLLEGVKKELYPCRNDIFKLTYEKEETAKVKESDKCEACNTLLIDGRCHNCEEGNILFKP